MPNEKNTPETEEQEALNEEQLDGVAAGLNPQPLPPIVRDHV